MSRLVLVALLLGATALFAAGALAERSHSEPAHVEAQEHGEEHADETVLGADTESTPLIGLAVLAGLALAALAALRAGRGALLTIALIALAWAALDVREAVQQPRTGIAIVAIVVAVLHLAAAATAGRLAGRAATMPA